MDKTYDDGLREGKLKALEQRMTNTEGRIDHHEKRLQILERLAWIMFGGLLLMKFLPEIQLFFQSV